MLSPNTWTVIAQLPSPASYSKKPTFYNFIPSSRLTLYLTPRTIRTSGHFLTTFGRTKCLYIHVIIVIIIIIIITGKQTTGGTSEPIKTESALPGIEPPSVQNVAAAHTQQWYNDLSIDKNVQEYPLWNQTVTLDTQYRHCSPCAKGERRRRKRECSQRCNNTHVDTLLFFPRDRLTAWKKAQQVKLSTSSQYIDSWLQNRYHSRHTEKPLIWHW